MKQTEVAWLAGLLEGEGTFVVRPIGRGDKYFTCQIHCSSTDKDVIDSVVRITGVGRVYLSSRSAKNPNHNDIWRWIVAKRRDVKEILQIVRPYLHSRRAAQADKQLATINQVQEHWRQRKGGHAADYTSV